MTDEHMRRTMEFIVEQQAQFAAGMQRLEEGFQRHEKERKRDRPRLARLEKSFQRVVELLEIQESRLDRAEFDTTAVERRTSALETSMTALANAQAHADERLSALIDVVMQDRGKGSLGRFSA